MKRIFIHRIAVRASALILTAFIVAISGVSYQALAQARALSLADILIALRSKKAVPEEKNKILADAVKERGITFSLTSEIEKELDNTGAQQALIAAIREKNAPAKSTLAAAQPEVKVPDPVAKPAPPPPDFAFYRTKATEALKANDFDAAMLNLNKAAELKPASASIYADRGLIHMRKEEFEAAIGQYNKAVELDPNDSSSYFNLGTIKEWLGRTDEAIDAFDRAAAINSNDDLAKNAAARLRKVRSDAAAALAAAAKPAPIETKPIVEPVKTPSFITVGPLNNYATRLVKPAYPSFEKRFGGDITVVAQVSLDIEGKVTSIKQIEGPKSIWNAIEYAIKTSAFKPVMLENGKPTAASGTLTYRFKGQ
ncbi:MAG: tetratricopeptide repeat protein [Pyrinomonadaceae bacterium]